MIIVPTDTPGFELVGNISVMGHRGADHQSHGEVMYHGAHVPLSNLLGEEGAGFELAQARLGAGRVHHCMRWIGICERAFDILCQRAVTRQLAPGDPLGSRQMVQQWVAESRAEIDGARLMVLHAAWTIERKGTSEARDDPARIASFVRQALPDAAGPVKVLQFPKGHSNLTDLLRVGDREVVLRRAPFGVKVKSAHDMKREFDILSALKGVYGRAPRPIAFCDDESLIGAKFYLMERVRGVILRAEKPPDGIAFTPELLRKTSAALVDNLADLHAVDVTHPPLSTIGRPQGYVARQVKGWTERYSNARTDEIRGVETAAAWLAR